MPTSEQIARSEPRGRARTRAKNKIWNTDAYKNKYVILLLDPNVGLHFVTCRVAPKRSPQGKVIGNNIVVYSFSSKEQAEAMRVDLDFRQVWMGYDTVVIRYEALKEFEDHHHRMHFDQPEHVMYFGTERQMDWIANLTAGPGVLLDRQKRLFLPKGVRAAIARPQN